VLRSNIFSSFHVLIVKNLTKILRSFEHRAPGSHLPSNHSRVCVCAYTAAVVYFICYFYFSGDDGQLPGLENEVIDESSREENSATRSGSRSAKRCPVCSAEVINLPRHLRSIHGWADVSARTAVERFGLHASDPLNGRTQPEYRDRHHQRRCPVIPAISHLSQGKQLHRPTLHCKNISAILLHKIPFTSACILFKLR